MRLSELKPNEIAEIKDIYLDSNTKSRFFNLGLTENTRVKIIKKAPFGDPVEIKVRGVLLAIRNKDAKNIGVIKIEE